MLTPLLRSVFKWKYQPASQWGAEGVIIQFEAPPLDPDSLLLITANHFAEISAR